MSTENEVREASKRFYQALNGVLNGKAEPMAEVWSHGASVTSLHPTGGREVGWEQVRSSLERVAKMAAGGRVELVDAVIQVGGELAYELGVERGEATLGGEKVAISQRVTNIYRRESGAWKLVHHHADAAPAMLDMMGRLKKKG